MKFKIKEKFTIKELKNLYDQKKINLNPPYQRNDIWSILDKKYLINSIEKNYPLPSFFLLEQDDGVFDMVDGQQRTRTIHSFLNNKSTDLDNNNLDQIDKEKFLNYVLTIVIISDLNKDDKIEDFYLRVNNLGKHLNRPELKKGVYYDTIFWKLIEKIAQFPEFTDLDIFTSSSLNRMNDLDFISELLTLLKIGIIDKKIGVDQIYEDDISEEENNELEDKFKNILSHFIRFNLIFPLKKTRYKQKNDFYTLFNFFNANIELKKDSFDYFYKILLIIDKAISPANEECEPFFNYAINCVSQSNSKQARKARLHFFTELFLNSNNQVNKTQLKILHFYKLSDKDIKKIEKYITLDFDKLNNKIKFKLF